MGHGRTGIDEATDGWLCEGEVLVMQDGHGTEAWWCDAHAEGEPLADQDESPRAAALRPPAVAG